MILRIPGRLPGLNELLAGKASQKNGWNAYNALKQRWYGQIRMLAQAARIEAIGPGYFTLVFSEPDRRRDPDNLAGGGIKLIFDSLVGAGVMKGDSWAHVLGFVSYWVHTPGEAGCLVHHGDALLTKDDALSLLEKENEHAYQQDRK